MVLRQPDIYTQKNEIGSLLHTIHRINSKWIDTNVKARNLQLLEENIGVIFVALS